MTGETELLTLAKAKLNITWDDAGTDARVEMILEDAVPVVSEMVGMGYESGEAVDETGEAFDFSTPGPERVVLMNYIAYEWNHQTGIFRDAYWNEIAACRQRHAMGSEENENGDEDG